MKKNQRNEMGGRLKMHDGFNALSDAINLAKDRKSKINPIGMLGL